MKHDFKEQEFEVYVLTSGDALFELSWDRRMWACIKYLGCKCHHSVCSLASAAGRSEAEWWSREILSSCCAGWAAVAVPPSGASDCSFVRERIGGGPQPAGASMLQVTNE